MKPEDLKSADARDLKRILIKDRIWYVPNTEDTSFSFPGWDHPDLFGNTNPIHIEYCSGNGAWIALKAATNPHINWVAVELKFDRVRKIWSKLKNRNLSNLLVIYGEAHHVTQRFIPTNSVNAVCINFPDPWPKRRHAKYRLIQPEFVSELQRTLTIGSPVDFVTDDANYSQWTIKMLKANSEFESAYPSPFYVSNDISYGTSYFDTLWREKGKTILYHRFLRKKYDISR